MKLLTYAILFTLTTITTNAQDLTGTWVGGGGKTEVKIVLVKCGDHYVGYTPDEDNMGFCKTNFLAEYNESSKQFKGKSVGFIDHTFMHSQTNYNLKYTTANGYEQLKGTASPTSVANKIMSFGIPIGVTLKRLSAIADTTGFMLAAIKKSLPADVAQVFSTTETRDTLSSITTLNKLNTPAANKDTTALITARQQRTNTIIETITTSSSKVLTKMYDNGVEDGDSISILHNNKVIRTNITVTTKPVIFELLLDDPTIDHDIT
jgi:hypothetical protein